jgi:hypothetical protein
MIPVKKFGLVILLKLGMLLKEALGKGYKIRISGRYRTHNSQR